MEIIGKFEILDSFKITGKGLVARGDIIEGNVKIGAYITINTGTTNVLLSINAVEMMDKISTREFWVGLMFVYKSKKEQDEFENIKLPVQIVDIMEDE
jgi:hypothetical protein